MQNLPKTTNDPDISMENDSPRKPKRRCLFCGQEAELIWVHGHGQCSSCGTNAEECCRGERCDL